MAVRSLAYVRVAAKDLTAWRAFGEQILGLAAVANDDPNVLLLRMDDRPWRFRIERSDHDRLLAAGLEFTTEADFQAALNSLRSAGVELTSGTPDGAQARAVRDYVTCADPSGNPLELCWGHVVTGTPFVSPVGTSHFVTDDGGMGHVVLPALKLKETRAFYLKHLGFGDSDEMRIPIEGGSLGLHFLHAAGPRHHTVAVGEFPHPAGLIHVMIEAPALDDVGLALDRALKAGHHLSATLGRHTNDKMVSFYVRSPSGFDVEYGCGGLLTPDWSTFTPTITQKEDLWGHKWDFGH
jgi:3,4-dihydroxy-9,10-secoandrosta-1,3,5(10)-triene-9,17-dione 4,5-dioxygenase